MSRTEHEYCSKERNKILSREKRKYFVLISFFIKCQSYKMYARAHSEIGEKKWIVEKKNTIFKFRHEPQEKKKSTE